MNLKEKEREISRYEKFLGKEIEFLKESFVELPSLSRAALSQPAKRIQFNSLIEKVLSFVFLILD